MRFTITWYSPEKDGGDYLGYKVSVANYDGGEVVTIDEVEKIEVALVVVRKQLKELQDKLREIQTED